MLDEFAFMRGKRFKYGYYLFTFMFWKSFLPNGIIANEAAEPRGSAVELAHHSAVREYTGNISSQRKGPFLTIFGCK